MTSSSRSTTQRSHFLGWFGLAVLAALVVLHMVSCLSGLHESVSGRGGGHHLSVPAHLEFLGAAANCGTDQAASSGSSAVHEDAGHDDDGHHHVPCLDDGALGWLDGGARSMIGTVPAAALAAVLLWSAGARPAAGCRGSPPEELPVGYWIRHVLRGAMLPAALGVSRT